MHFFSIYNGKKILCMKKFLMFSLSSAMVLKNMCEKISQTKQNKQVPSE